MLKIVHILCSLLGGQNFAGLLGSGAGKGEQFDSFRGKKLGGCVSAQKSMISEVFIGGCGRRPDKF